MNPKQINTKIMKTIKVNDEMYDFLMDLSNELNTQDHRCTAMPYFFQVRETKECPAHEGNGTEVLYSSEYELELRTEEEKIEFLKDHVENYKDIGWDDELSEIDELDEYTIDSILCQDDFDKFYVDDIHEYSNCFFTSKACDEHIRINGHNLHKPINYLNHAYRNVEIDTLLKFLCELNGGETHK